MTLLIKLYSSLHLGIGIYWFIRVSVKNTSFSSLCTCKAADCSLNVIRSLCLRYVLVRTIHCHATLETLHLIPMDAGDEVVIECWHVKTVHQLLWRNYWEEEKKNRWYDVDKPEKLSEGFSLRDENRAPSFSLENPIRHFRENVVFHDR